MRPLRICINGMSVVTGGGLVNLAGLVQGLARVDRDNEYIVLVPARQVHHFVTGAPNFRLRPLNVGEQHVLGRVLWEQLRLANQLERERADLLFSPANIAPLKLPSHIRSVVKVQNIAPFSPVALGLERGLRARTRLRALRWLTLGALRGADGVIYISRSAARMADGRGRQATVIYDGLTVARPGLGREEARREAEQRYSLSSLFVLCVADFYPYKNLEVLIRGFGLLPRRIRDGHTLVLVGRPMTPWYARRVQEEIAVAHGARIQVIPGLPHGQLEALYAAASVYAFPSRVEAGGTTLVEAMAAGRPIVASNIETAVEFCGEAALYCRPERPGEWASALERALTDEDLALRLGEAGRARAASFTWEESARRTAELFEAVSAG